MSTAGSGKPQILVPEWPGLPASVHALCTTRCGGVSAGPYGGMDGGLNLGAHVGDAPEAVAANRALLRRLLPAEPAWLSQVHGARVVDACAAQGVPEADAAVADRPGVVCAIMTADCLPVLFSDAGGRVVGAAHAGWRGLAGGVLENTLARMRDAGAQAVSAWMGPAIGPERFEVGDDVRQAFVAAAASDQDAFAAIEGKPGKYLADIYALARRRLARAGAVAVHGGGFCTVEDRDRFYSYRRDGVTGRMAALIWFD
ncbi:conserved hypothetical protein [Noviherbaspirillum humi]|uniref:Purine nucleoside phosphorylase n=1 Tax=Noviherbaspirillum humi TaxID=1688639 RepID=A0A239H399_9BURK|nr:peptidoglycan editing factor PgeF [Noviherbaspirillum humi]SNS75899.1 conserved hypothetical protein [Noviherbaspirillum humi]